MLFRRRPRITVYTTPGCPDCRALKQWLGEHGLDYEERDLSDPGVMQQAKARYGVRVAPITVIGKRFYYGGFAEQRPHLARALGMGGQG